MPPYSPILGRFFSYIRSIRGEITKRYTLKLPNYRFLIGFWTSPMWFVMVDLPIELCLPALPSNFIWKTGNYRTSGVREFSKIGDRTHLEHSLSPPKNRFRLSHPGAEKVRTYTLLKTDLRVNTWNIRQIGSFDFKDIKRTILPDDLYKLRLSSWYFTNDLNKIIHN